ncbi:hypothetical protein SDC9_128341 [bioreactor metagenome]|uniref:Uncharacterized protein n=1 Tax=bioreactor metagenome TaxID=1076179 RepID=A0A645CWK1_9ZZZZ
MELDLNYLKFVPIIEIKPSIKYIEMNSFSLYLIMDIF